MDKEKENIKWAWIFLKTEAFFQDILFKPSEIPIPSKEWNWSLTSPPPSLCKMTQTSKKICLFFPLAQFPCFFPLLIFLSVFFHFSCLFVSFSLPSSLSFFISSSHPAHKQGWRPLWPRYHCCHRCVVQCPGWWGCSQVDSCRSPRHRTPRH